MPSRRDILASGMLPLNSRPAEAALSGFTQSGKSRDISPSLYHFVLDKAYLLSCTNTTLRVILFWLPARSIGPPCCADWALRSEERRVGQSVDLGGRCSTRTHVICSVW